MALNSDARSEVEGLRWVLTRRAAITLGISAFLLFAGLRYASYVQHQAQDEKRKPPPHRPSPMEELADASPLVQSPGQGLGIGQGHQDVLGGEVLATEGVSVG